MNKKKSQSVTHTLWLVGGGTAGHIMPLLAVAEILRQDRKIHLTYLGDKNGRESSLTQQLGIRFRSIPNGKFRRYFSISALFLNLRDFFRLVRGVYVSYHLIKKEKPSLIFSKGGPVALPIAIAAFLTHTRLITHESDAVLGLTNRIIATFAERILTAFPLSTYPGRYIKKITSVGLPIRRTFCQSRPHKKHTRPMILVTGGSQGAKAINELLSAILPDLLKRVSVMHLTGELSYEYFLNVKAKLPGDLSAYYGVLDFTSDIAGYMEEADIVISRASSTIFEIASLGKPMILIPLPSAANNHQLKNAEVFLRHHAALLLNQENLTPNLLYETIVTLLNDRQLRNQLKEGTRNFNSCDAAKRVAEILRQYVR